MIQVCLSKSGINYLQEPCAECALVDKNSALTDKNRTWFHLLQSYFCFLKCENKVIGLGRTLSAVMFFTVASLVL